MLGDNKKRNNYINEKLGNAILSDKEKEELAVVFRGNTKLVQDLAKTVKDFGKLNELLKYRLDEENKDNVKDWIITFFLIKGIFELVPTVVNLLS